MPETSAPFSSGGFSDVFAQPEYQLEHVTSYLNSIGADAELAGRYNASGRGFPDVSLQAQTFEIVVGDDVTYITGTSASCPVLASMIALVNDRLLAQGENVLGFLNPM